MSPSDYPILLTRKQAAELTGLDERYFDRLRRAGRIRSYKTLGGLHRLYRDEVLEHIGHFQQQQNNQANP